MAKRKAPAVAPSTAWRNRIVSHAERPASEFLANPANWRIHPKAQQEVLRSVIGSAVGWIQSVIVNVRTSPKWPVGERNVETLLDGHARVQLALREGDETPVPTTYVDLDPEEERIALATFDPISSMAATDSIKFDELVVDIPESRIDLTAILEHVVPSKKERVRGLSHDVKRCECCADGRCKDPDCGCYRRD